MEKLAGLLHISRKAGKLLLGRTSISAAVKKRGDVLVLTSRDANPRLLKSFGRSEIMKTGLSSKELGNIFDRDRLSFLGIIDRSLAAGVREIVRGQSKSANR